MTPEPRTNRRRFLTLTAAGTAAVAGCTDGSDQEAGPTQPSAAEQPETAPDGTGGDRTVSIIVQPNPGALREAQLEVSTALEEGELEREEAERELAEREQELIEAAVDDARARIDQVGAVHVDTVEREGTLLVEGSADAILDLLEQPSISAVLSQERFEQAERRAGATGDGSGATVAPDSELEPGSEADTDEESDSDPDEDTDSDSDSSDDD
ncbi:twin-arginine translocation signal domain-containing protein [Natrarchaeobaculum aegyptiacum]|uniref:Uncharacterized protein n=1 Tax=Natrarchaeobaculum aegyptiacum TaxID=745377 RepID=A0A2Z2HUI4_9EURY|nr:twin-arginine translocation signal domain-containing protein [Natrarchaeobaculum aegyptiacum]ARS90956.1 hypothetical protein B1756_15270 [Natrarchaeobaculum aegyptiacum]